MKNIFRFFTGIIVGVLIIVSILSGIVIDRKFDLNIIDKYLPKLGEKGGITERQILNEESVVTEVVGKVGPSVVTVGIKKTQQVFNPFDNFFDPFGIFNIPRQALTEQKIEQDIGSGFVVSKDGLVVTNKHVVADTSASYRVFLADNKLYEVDKIFRDPSADLAILKINAPKEELKPVELGDSSKLKVGQFVIAIGTALGEFRNTVTTGVISGLGRGIMAGSPFEGSENLDNVIQTDAAINPGNSGGPLLNSLGQVIAVNVAVASGAQNIGFALPINVVKDSLDNFNQTGQFSRPYLGVRFRMIDKKEAIAKNWIEGAGIVEVVSGSPADKAGLKQGDIVTKIDEERLNDKNDLAKIIAKKKVGQEIKISFWRDNEEKTISVTLKEAS